MISNDPDTNLDAETIVNQNIDPDLNFVIPEIYFDYYDQCKFLHTFSTNTGLKL